MKIFKPVYENLGEYKLDVSNAVDAFKRLTAATQNYAGAVDTVNAVIIKYNQAGTGFTAKIEATTVANAKIISTIKSVNGVLTEESTRVKNLTQDYNALSTAKEAANKRLVSRGIDSAPGSAADVGVQRLAASQAERDRIQLLVAQATQRYAAEAKARGAATNLDLQAPGGAVERLIMYRIRAEENAAKESIRIAREAEEVKTRYFAEESRKRNQILLNQNRLADAVERARAYRSQVGTAPAVATVAPKVNYQAAYQNTFAKANQDMIAARSATLGLVSAQNTLVQSNKEVVTSSAAKQQQVVGFSKPLRDHATDVHNAAGAWRYWLRFVATQTIHKFIYDLINVARSGLAAITDLQVKISEIRTIGQEKPLGFETWLGEIRNLSDIYGGTIEKVTEGVYQTISNQVAQGADATRFMADAMVFARTSVSTTDEAVNLLSSSLNAYGKSSQTANEDAASLFKTIEIGRVRANQIANSFGNVAVTASEMGVSLDTVGAMLATMTVQGKNVDVSMTQIRNIMIKLLKPTEELGNYFKSIGQESGESAVKAYGFVNLLQKINAEANKPGKGPTWLAKMFGDIRPIQGILSLTGDKMGQFQSIVEQYNNKQAYYFKATQVAVESSGKALQMEMNRLRNYFVVDVAGSVLSTINGMILRTEDGVAVTGGLVEAYKTLISALEKVAAAYVGYRLAVIVAIDRETMGVGGLVKLYRLLAGTKVAAAGMSLAGGAGATIRDFTALKTLIASVINLTNILRVSIGALAAMTIYWAYNQAKAVYSINAEYQNLLTTVRELDTVTNDKHFKALKAIEDENNAILAQSDLLEQEMRQAAGARQAILNTNISDMTTSLLSNSKAIGDALTNTISKVKEVVKVIDEEIKNIAANLQDIKKNATNITSGLASLGFYSKVIDSLGQINDGHEKARRTLQQYQDLLRRGAVIPSTAALRDLPNTKGVKDTQGDMFKRNTKLKQESDLQATSFEIAQINERMTAYQKFYQLLKRNAEEAYANNNIEQGRAFTAEMLSLAEKLYDVGFDYNKVLDARTSILQNQVNAEKDIAAVEEARQQRLLKQKEAYTAVIDALNLVKDDLGNVSLNSKNIDTVKIRYAKAISDIKATLASSVFDTKIKAQLMADLSTNKSSFDQTAALQQSLAELDKSTTSTIEDLDKSITDQLKLMIELEKAQLEKASIEEAIQSNTEMLKERQQDVAKASSERVAPINAGMELGNAAIEAFKKIANETVKVVEFQKDAVTTVVADGAESTVIQDQWVTVDKSIQSLIPGFNTIMSEIRADINNVSKATIGSLLKPLQALNINTDAGINNADPKQVELKQNIFALTKYLQSLYNVKGKTDTATSTYNTKVEDLTRLQNLLVEETKKLKDLVSVNINKNVDPKDAKKDKDGKGVQGTVESEDSPVTKQLKKIEELNKEMLRTQKEVAKSTDTTSTNVDKLANPMKEILGGTKSGKNWKDGILGGGFISGGGVQSLGGKDAFKQQPVGEIYKANVFQQTLMNAKLAGLDTGGEWSTMNVDDRAASRSDRADYMSSPVDRASRNTYANEGEQVVNVYLDGKIVGQEVVSNITRGAQRGSNNIQLQNNADTKTRSVGIYKTGSKYTGRNSRSRGR